MVRDVVEPQHRLWNAVMAFVICKNAIILQGVGMRRAVGSAKSPLAGTAAELAPGMGPLLASVGRHVTFFKGYGTWLRV